MQPPSEASRPAVRHVEIDAEQAGRRLDQFLLKLFGSVPRSRIYRLVRKGEVRVNGHRADPAQRLQLNDKVRVPPVRIEPEGAPPRVPRALLERVKSAIIIENDKLLVIDKPSGIAVHGGSGLSFGIIEVLRALRPHDSLELVHRLDRDTSGCLLVARKASALRVMHALLREGEFEKRYLTLVKGHWQHGHKRIDVALRTDTRVGGERTVKAHVSGKQAVSDFRPLQFFAKRATLMEVGLLTGRTHQIRVHAAHAGHVVAGDSKYGDADFNQELAALGLERMFLHAHSVSFEWPEGGTFSASAPLPPDLASVVDALNAAVPRRRPYGKE
ncbi:MAG TPA: RluA family pseudouridine synthase [Steroidobacteraceae bacterium]